MSPWDEIYFMLNVPLSLMCLPLQIPPHFHILHWGLISSLLHCVQICLRLFQHASSFFIPPISFPVRVYPPISSPPLPPRSIKVELYRSQQCKTLWAQVLKTVSLYLGFIVSLERCRVTTCHKHIGRHIHFTQGHISRGYTVCAHVEVCFTNTQVY